MVEGEKSDPAAVTSGVPQGTVLGPILFLAFINDLPCHAKHSTVRLFADDCVLQMEINSPHDCAKLQEDVDSIAEWERRWLMEFNAAKCEVMSIQANRSPTLHDYYLHGHILNRTNATKYLGVTISSDLKWNSHIANITAKANRTLGLLRRNLQVGDVKTKEKAYFSLVRPQVEYASNVWDPYTTSLKSKIEMVQRRSARYATRRYHNTSSVASMLDTLKWDTLENRREQARLTMFYKVVHNMVALPKEDFLIQSNRPSRHGSHISFLHIPARTDYFKNSFFPRTVPQWNRLDSAITSAETLTQFKCSLSKLY